MILKFDVENALPLTGDVIVNYQLLNNSHELINT